MGKILEESDFLSFELMDEDGMLTNAGALLAEDSPVRHSRLFCTRWHGLDKASGVMDALDDKEYSGGLISLERRGVCQEQYKETVEEDSGQPSGDA